MEKQVLLLPDLARAADEFAESVQPTSASYKSVLLLPLADYSSPISLRKLKQATKNAIPAPLRSLKLVPGTLMDEKELNWVFKTDKWRVSQDSVKALLNAMPPGVVSPKTSRVAVWGRLDRALERQPTKVAAYDSKAFFIIEGTEAYLVTIDFGNRLFASSCPEYNSTDRNARRRFGICFPPGTLVETPRGPRAIETLLPGDTVFGQTGIQAITETFTRLYTGGMVTLKALYCDEVMVTPEHPILVTRVRRGPWEAKRPLQVSDPVWVPAKDVTPSDYVVVPKKPTYHSLPMTVDFAEFYEGPSNRNPLLDKQVEIDEEMAELLGIYLADGSLSIRKAIGSRPSPIIQITLGSHEVDKASRVIQLAERLGMKSNIYRFKNEKAIRVYFSSTPFGWWLKKVGTTSHSKRIPEEFFYTSPTIKEALIRGFDIGDGTRSSHDGNYETTVLNTVNHRLARQLQRLLSDCGKRAWIRRSTQKAHYYKSQYIRGGQIYSVGYPSERVWPHFYQDDGFLYFKVRRVGKSPYTGPVYNLETSDHTYCVPFVVHNCKHVAAALIYYRGEVFCRAKLPPSELKAWEAAFARARSASQDILSNYNYYYIKKFVPLLGFKTAYYADKNAVDLAIRCILSSP